MYVFSVDDMTAVTPGNYQIQKQQMKNAQQLRPQMQTIKPRKMQLMDTVCTIWGRSAHLYTQISLFEKMEIFQ